MPVGTGFVSMPCPIPPYLEVADEMGVCVLDETAIWASYCQNNYDEPVAWEHSFYDFKSLRRTAFVQES